jgi:hypothetical protein
MAACKGEDASVRLCLQDKEGMDAAYVQELCMATKGGKEGEYSQAREMDVSDAVAHPRASVGSMMRRLLNRVFELARWLAEKVRETGWSACNLQG